MKIIWIPFDTVNDNVNVKNKIPTPIRNYFKALLECQDHIQRLEVVKTEINGKIKTRQTETFEH